jgi:hypothetical protein
MTRVPGGGGGGNDVIMTQSPHIAFKLYRFCNHSVVFRQTEARPNVNTVRYSERIWYYQYQRASVQQE